jgi:hypothetical protein
MIADGDTLVMLPHSVGGADGAADGVPIGDAVSDAAWCCCEGGMKYSRSGVRGDVEVVEVQVVCS